MRVQRYQAFNKIADSIESCTTVEQVKVCVKMVMLFHKMYYDRQNPQGVMKPCATLSNLILKRRCELALYYQ